MRVSTNGLAPNTTMTHSYGTVIASNLVLFALLSHSSFWTICLGWRPSCLKCSVFSKMVFWITHRKTSRIFPFHSFFLPLLCIKNKLSYHSSFIAALKFCSRKPAEVRAFGCLRPATIPCSDQQTSHGGVSLVPRRDSTKCSYDLSLPSGMRDWQLKCFKVLIAIGTEFPIMPGQ